VLLDRIRWSAVFFGFLATCLCTFLAVPLFEHIGWQVNAGPVDMLTMLSILIGGFVAGKAARRDEGIQGGLVAVCYILVIWLGKQVLDEIHIANLSGLSALGKVDSWSNFGKDFFYFVRRLMYTAERQENTSHQDIDSPAILMMPSDLFRRHETEQRSRGTRWTCTYRCRAPKSFALCGRVTFGGAHLTILTEPVDED